MNRVLIANRGAIARRVVRACHELNIECVVVYSTADRGAPYIEEADFAVELPGRKATDTYLNQELLLYTAAQSACDSIHPGYGFLAENAEFALLAQRQGLKFIGPDAKWLAQLGDKIAARKTFAQFDFPVFGGSELLTDVDMALASAESIGYPLMLKPSGGGGGMGMEIVEKAEQLGDAMQRAAAIAGQAFGNSGVYLERYIRNPRHIEFQILADDHGQAIHLYERECSVQRRNQKLIEESPAPGIDAVMVEATANLAAQACTKLSYDNVGTVETLLSASGEFGFLEMNTRIQVEHGVTELVTGIDLVQQQFLMAQGQPVPKQPQRQGHAIEARIYAEDPRTYMPSTGLLKRFHFPRLEQVRVETGYQVGQMVTPYYDAMLAKVIAYGHTRELAIGRLLVALQACEISGVTTNIELLNKVLRDPRFLQGDVDTGIVDRILSQ